MGITWEVVVAAEMISGGGGRRRQRRRRPRLLHLELVRRRRVRADRRRHDQHRHRRISCAARCCGARRVPDAVAQDALAVRRRPMSSPAQTRRPPKIRAGEIKVDRRRQVLRRPALRQSGGRRLLVHHRAGQAHGDDRTFRLRQEHADPPARRLREADQRQRSRSNDKPVTGPGKDRLVVFQETRAVPVDDDVRQHHVRPARARRGHARTLGARRDAARQGRPARLPQEVPDAAVGRHAAPGGAGARDDQQSARS